MKSEEIRNKFLEFFEKRGHKIIPSSSLIPENDSTTLFTGSGMQPMVPFLLGAKHPEGKRIVDSQKSFRTGDIEDVGDNRHTTFFEMLGNWSLGDYFKKEQIEWIFEFLTKEIGLDPQKIYVSAFIGDNKNGMPKDTEAGEIWKNLFKNIGIEAKEVDIGSEENGYKVGMQGGRIFYYDAKKNWWSGSGVLENMLEGEPGGPDSEMFYEFTDMAHDPKFGKYCHLNCDCGRFLEIGNNVFMEYKKVGSKLEKLLQKNIDFGGGLERLVAVSENQNDIFKTDFFKDTIEELEKISGQKYIDPQYTRYFRIVLDHLRASIFLLADGVIPSNSDRGYVLRKLIRRTWIFLGKLKPYISSDQKIIKKILEKISNPYLECYPEIKLKRVDIENRIIDEIKKAGKALVKGSQELYKRYNQKNELTSEDIFDLYQTFGIHKDFIRELIESVSITFKKDIIDGEKRKIVFDEKSFENKIKEHQSLSKVGSEQKFKGGLGGHSEMEVKYHTATHLLHQALRDVLGDHVEQKGSNITPDRLRFDFSHPQKMTEEEKKKVENIVNKKIKENLLVQNIILPKTEAEKSGALHFFGEKYGDTVSVYFIGNSIEGAYSKEFCGGPHVQQTGDLRAFKIQKEEAVSAGIRRIKAILE